MANLGEQAANAPLPKSALATDALNNFLKLLTPADRKVTWGQTYMHFASSTSASAQITHGLGVAPVFMAAVPYEGGGVYFYYNVGVASHADPTNYFWVKGWSDSGVAATTNDLYFYWLAIG